MPLQASQIMMVPHHRLPKSFLFLHVELTRKNGVSKGGDSLMCNEVAYSKATGLIYYNVEWVNSVDTLAALPPPCERSVSTWTLHGWTAGAETSEREIYLRATLACSSRLPSLPQASRSYVPFAPSCLNSLTPDAHRAGPLHPIAGSAEAARCPSFPASTFG